MRTLLVKPDLPEELEVLRTIGMNLWYSWNPSASRLFQSIDPDLWAKSGHNPVLMLASLPQERIQEVLQDPAILERIRALEQSFEDYIGKATQYSFNLPRPIDYRVAYFSMEYGLHEALPMYSGGLGVLAGDHLKSASNLCFPILGMGLLYQKGYFKQYLNVDGWQQELYPDNDFYNLPLSPVKDATGKHVSVDMDIAGEKVKVLIWRIQVGRIPLYLLDTSHRSNSPEARQITAELYGGDGEMRIRQEIVLGIGGTRAFHQLGHWPFVFHLNEGHAAFAALERIRQTILTYRVPFDVALEAVAASTVFTTHTPVPAGIDYFDPALVEKYFSQYMRSMGMTTQDLLDLGREDPRDFKAPLSMAVLALRLSRGVNAVSHLHSRVSKKMWRTLWPHLEEEDIPIGYVTNGVHIPSYLSKEMADLFERYLGEGWIEEPDNQKIWSRVFRIPHDQLWNVHVTRRERLVVFCRLHFLSKVKGGGGSSLDIRRAVELLNSEALTIGFARRFAPYKRATLLFTDPDRLLRIVSDKRRPVQFIFAGKAHPRDRSGKELIKKVVHQARSEGFHRKLVFLEDYDMNIARYLVQGVDVWLNTPRRPMEACGTSGMKAAANGALNLSILDGWWPEAFDGTNGWAIGGGEEYDDLDYQDHADAEALYDVLEKEVIPTFFDRGPDGLPRKWIDMMKNSMAKICVQFNSHRMIEDYIENYYVAAGLAHQILSENRLSRARELRDWKQRVRALWKDVRVLDVSLPRGDRAALGEEIDVIATIELGGLGEQEVIVDLCHGALARDGERLLNRELTAMNVVEQVNPTTWRFKGTIPCEETGVYAYHVRVLPFHPYVFDPLSLGLVAWG